MAQCFAVLCLQEKDLFPRELRYIERCIRWDALRNTRHFKNGLIIKYNKYLVRAH